MEGRLDTLPTELLLAIISQLRNRDLASLLATNKLLFQGLDPIFRDREHVVDLAMGWACSHGNCPAIRRLVSLGVSPSVVSVSTIFSGRYITTSTLHLAATRKQVEAFQCLLGLGARLDHPDLGKGTMPHFVSRICNPVQDWALLRLYLDFGLDHQLRMGHYLHHPPATVPLLGVISQSTTASPLGPVRLLLDRGGDPNEIFNFHGNRLVTPLTEAIRRGHTDVLDLLIGNGGTIHGPRVIRPVRQPWHIPIMAAVACMSSKGTAMVERCLHHGADINRLAAVICENSDHNYKRYQYMNPALVYVDSVLKWDDPTHALRPVDALIYLTSRGARLQQPIPTPDRGDLEWIQNALEKWGLTRQITSPGLVVALQYLLRNAASVGTLAQSLAAYDPQFSVSGHKVLRLSETWQNLLSYVLEGLNVDPTVLLGQYILQRGLHMAMSKPYDFDSLGMIGRATIERLLVSGANINARIGTRDGPTALHAVCEAFSKERPTMEEAQQFHFWPGKGGNQAEYLKYLASRGADPSIRIGGRTAGEALLEEQADMPPVIRRNMLLLSNLLEKLVQEGNAS
ncbi:hypothetical protein N7461_008237 [Penicillium sp. DV-2018c]|nr:hypothetical protein N7461_008237 [Penicillium sp. DV-2018c]